MKNTPVDRISKLVEILPGKDLKLANEFIESRRFQDLYDLVKSDIKKAEKFNKENPQSNIDIDSLNSLLAEIISYLDIIGWDEDEYDEDEEY